MPVQHKIALLTVILLLFTSVEGLGAVSRNSSETKPWTYWWWMGSSVTKKGITENLEKMHAAGLGGVHIIPIYGEKGDEQNYIPYLSPAWMEMLRHTVREATRLDMGVDMTSGTGWPFGGPAVENSDAAKSFYVRQVKIENSANISDYQKPKSNSRLVALVAYDPAGNPRNITKQVDSLGVIHWGDVGERWRAVAAFQGFSGQKVKRAAPGGEGLVLDYFSESAIANYLKQFEEAFRQAGNEKINVRAFYHDSFEAYGANYTPDFLSEFRNRRGYNLLDYLNYLADTIASDTRQRVVTDYCETISDLLYEKFTATWVRKCHETGMLTRNQAHGSPGNILDLYALSDIPETESFGASGFSIPGLRQDPDFEEDRFGRPNPLTMKFASSAAHIAGRRLVSSESTTWLGDHFKVSLSQVKPQIDELFVSGINHIFFHGTTYSPPEKPFPGRLFYASTNYGPSSHFWNELPALTGYIARCQEVLQNSQPDNDILLYFPIHEVWRGQKSEQIIRLFDVHKSKSWLQDSNFGRLAQKLREKGYTFDYVSDRMISGLRTDGGGLLSGNARYKAIVVPATDHMPLSTLSALNELAKKGAAILFEKKIPADVPGLADLEQKRVKMADLSLDMRKLSKTVAVTADITGALQAIAIPAENLSRAGLEFTRRKSGDTTFYFITNLSNTFREGWLELTVRPETIEIYDPVTGRRGTASIRKTPKGTAVYLQADPGQSCILTCSGKKTARVPWNYLVAEEKEKMELNGSWTLKPTAGAPVIPGPVQLQNLGSWTKLGGDFVTFSGKAIYSTTFEIPNNLLKYKEFILDLGIVRETASVRINGRGIGLCWCLPNRLLIPEGIIRKTNTIEIEVTNLSFNRIIRIDKDGGKWKNFHEVNFVNIRYQPYDASDKSPEDSGLIAPVYLLPARQADPLKESK